MPVESKINEIILVDLFVTHAPIVQHIYTYAQPSTYVGKGCVEDRKIGWWRPECLGLPESESAGDSTIMPRARRNRRTKMLPTQKSGKYFIQNPPIFQQTIFRRLSIFLVFYKADQERLAEIQQVGRLDQDGQRKIDVKTQNM